jgi:hypothetical protein
MIAMNQLNKDGSLPMTFTSSITDSKTPTSKTVSRKILPNMLSGQNKYSQIPVTNLQLDVKKPLSMGINLKTPRPFPMQASKSIHNNLLMSQRAQYDNL